MQGVRDLLKKKGFIHANKVYIPRSDCFVHPDILRDKNVDIKDFLINPNSFT